VQYFDWKPKSRKPFIQVSLYSPPAGCRDFKLPWVKYADFSKIGNNSIISKTNQMPARSRSEEKYAFRYSLRAEDPQSYDFGASRDEIQQFVNASLGMLTGGCEMCEFAHRNNSPALFCEKKKSPVNWGAPRCEYFIRNSVRTQDLLA